MKKNFLKKVATGLVAAVAGLSLIGGSAVLADNDSATAKAPTEGTSAQVTITKTLNVPEGVTTPDATFTFNFTGKTSTTTATEIPEISDKTVSYTSSDKQDPYTTGKLDKATGNIFEGVSYTETGEYVYTVKEANTGYTPLTDTTTGQTIDAMDFDKSEYEMHVLVKEKDGQKYISSVYFKQTKDSAGNEISQDKGKVEPVDPSNPGNLSYNLFKNTYTKEAGKTPTDPKTPDSTQKSLVISKTVTSTHGLGDKNKEFTFNLTFTAPKHEITNGQITTQYSGKIVDKNETTIQEITFSAGTTTQFTLKDGEKLEFDKLPAGARYTLTETGTKNYTPSAAVVENGKDSVTVNGTKSADLTTPASGTYLVGEKKNTNDITNKFEDDDVTPTGLLINNLPFILMIGLGAAIFIGVARRRHQN